MDLSKPYVTRFEELRDDDGREVYAIVVNREHATMLNDLLGRVAHTNLMSNFIYSYLYDFLDNPDERYCIRSLNGDEIKVLFIEERT